MMLLKQGIFKLLLLNDVKMPVLQFAFLGKLEDNYEDLLLSSLFCSSRHAKNIDS